MGPRPPPAPNNQILKACTGNIGWGLSFAHYGGGEIPLIDTGF
jgi:hypothetical protein